MKFVWDSGWVSACASCASLITTVIYLRLTTRALRVSESSVQVSQEMARISRHQIALQNRPYIQIMAAPRPGNQVLQLIIANSGNNPALALKLDISPTFRQYHDKNRKPLQELPLFANEIGSLHPSARIVFDLGVGYQFFQGAANDAISPPHFTVTARYRGVEGTYVETTEIDLHLFEFSSASRDGELAELHEIGKELERINRSIATISENILSERASAEKLAAKRAWLLQQRQRLQGRVRR